MTQKSTPKPTVNQSEYDVRLKKLDALKHQHIDPYPAASKRQRAILDFKNQFDASSQISVTLAGRIRSLRQHGKVTFFDLTDASARIQLVLKSDVLGEKIYDALSAYDMGDFIEATGTAYMTKRGEQSLLVSHLAFLTKSLRPLPEKWHGIKDEEERYRKRYLDILSHPEVKEMFLKKMIFWNSMREFLVRSGFTEVETPVLENTTGGADAVPFATHHNALDIDVYLRISAGELWQKKLLVAGFEKIFEIGRIFRNEGISPEHLQDYTQMEFYWAYADYEDGMKFTEELYKYVAQKTFQTLKFTIKNFNIDFSKPWQRYDYHDEVLKNTSIDILTAKLPQVLKKLDELDVTYEKNINLGRAIDCLWKYCRKSIAGPGFLVNHPISVSPLSKRQKNNPDLAQRFQIILAGSEMGNGYSELNDPIDQKKRFEEQAKLRDSGDQEAHMPDYEFVEALEYGMPPACGFGISERLFSFLMDKPARECVIFPLLRPKAQKKIE